MADNSFYIRMSIMFVWSNADSHYTACSTQQHMNRIFFGPREVVPGPVRSKNKFVLRYSPYFLGILECRAEVDVLYACNDL